MREWGRESGQTSLTLETTLSHHPTTNEFGYSPPRPSAGAPWPPYSPRMAPRQLLAFSGSKAGRSRSKGRLRLCDRHSDGDTQLGVFREHKAAESCPFLKASPEQQVFSTNATCWKCHQAPFPGSQALNSSWHLLGTSKEDREIGILSGTRLGR